MLRGTVLAQRQRCREEPPRETERRENPASRTDSSVVNPAPETGRRDTPVLSDSAQDGEKNSRPSGGLQKMQSGGPQSGAALVDQERDTGPHALRVVQNMEAYGSEQYPLTDRLRRLPIDHSDVVFRAPERFGSVTLDTQTNTFTVRALRRPSALARPEKLQMVVVVRRASRTTTTNARSTC